MRKKRKKLGRDEGRLSLEQICDDLAAKAQRVKTEMCRLDAGPVDLNPLLFLRLDGAAELCFVPFPCSDPVAGFPLIWERILEEGHPDFIAIFTEGYFGPYHAEKGHQRGQYERDFKENPFSDVKEALLIAGVDIRQGRYRNAVIPFSYDDGGMPHFTQYPWGDGSGGNLGGLLAGCVRQVQRRMGW